VEGIEAEAPERWVVGVQWHPENLVRLENGTGRAALGIFQGFVAAMAGR
jgi:gamma-glutamyl-gamma-aminobutyrate hydrolase PuuD